MPLPALNRPLSWTSTDPDVVSVLNDVQANILKGHGRVHTINLFLRFDPDRADDARAAIHQLSGQLKCAKQQLAEAEIYKRSGKKTDGGTLRCFFLSYAGYAALGVPQKAPAGKAFRDGMKGRPELGDDPSEWDEHFQGEIDAMLLLADDRKARLDADSRSLEASLGAAGIEVIGKEIGKQIFNDADQGVEHFGYVDGRSKPLLLAEDAQVEQLNGDSMWDPRFPASQVLLTGENRVIGSFFVFRKLEQNVHAFRAAKREVAAALKLPGSQDELAGALIIGRFRDGTPVVLRSEDGFGGRPMNNFNYDDDAPGNKCPMHAHVRKVNPRGSSAEPLWLERRHVLARRGITYGNRSKDLRDAPKEGVGILFMAYQARLEDGFEFIQTQWANQAAFPGKNGDKPGIDPVIGIVPPKKPGDRVHDPVPIEYRYAERWGGAPAPKTKKPTGRAAALASGAKPAPEPVASVKVTPTGADGLVSVKGGEYFFAPVISDLKML